MTGIVKIVLPKIYPVLKEDGEKDFSEYPRFFYNGKEIEKVKDVNIHILPGTALVTIKYVTEYGHCEFTAPYFIEVSS